jgi:hypothetical protein
MFICLLFFLCNPPWYYSIRAILINNLSWIFQEGRYSSLVSLSIGEMILTFVYMFFAFICTQFGVSNTNYSVTPRVLIHWFIEASSHMVIFVAAFCEYCIEWDGDLLNKYPLYTIIGITMKVPLFISMRYAERESDFFVNDLKVSFADILCEWH